MARLTTAPRLPHPAGAARPAPRIPVHTRPFLDDRVLRQLSSGRDVLATWWPTVILGLAALLLTVCAVRAARRRRGRRGAAAVSGLAAVLTLALAAAAGVNSYAGYLPSVAAVRTWVTGRLSPRDGEVKAVRIPPGPGSGLAVTTTYVYTPPGYRAGAGIRYPVVYLLHGSPGTSVDWFAAGNIAHTLGVLAGNHLLPPVIAVAPDLNAPTSHDTECLNSTRPGGPQESTYLDRVVAWTDAHYATQPRPSGRLVAGMSSGGYCALQQGLSQQRLYGGIIALEPYGCPGSGGRVALSTPQQYRAVCPTDYVPAMTFRHSTPTFLDMAGAGRSPVSSHQTRLVAAELARRHQPVYLRREAGMPHNWTMASTGAPYGLVWTARHLHLRDERDPR